MGVTLGRMINVPTFKMSASINDINVAILANGKLFWKQYPSFRFNT